VDKFHFDKLNIGGSLTALLHAYKTSTPIIIDEPRPPFELEPCPTEWDLSFLGFSPEKQINKIYFFERLAFLLSMAGLVVFPNNIQTIRYKGDHVVVVTTGKRRINVFSKELLLFDEKKEDLLTIHDWFDVKSGANHDLQIITDNDGLCSEVIFYPSTRSSVPKSVKDLCVVSKISPEEIDNIEYSPAYVRLKTLHMMNTAGIRGKINGYSKDGKPKHLSVRIEHAYRDITKKPQNKITIEGLLDKKIDSESRLWKLTQKFLQQRTPLTLRASSL
jgi:hypothetical protein